ncbi:MAG: hypothetical protein C6I00_01370 [Nitratiruptor sp.]|nr:hypothetical protein [Nitratiruptor sp.]NPA83247.1 hypothetical protein [Campylobacterota bacterium]
MRFSQFMKEWLYEHYYSRYRPIGKRGDFYTAVSVSKLFGGAIANYIYRLIRDGKLSRQATIVEIGAHRGYLLADIVQFLYTFEPSLIEQLHFLIVEPFEELRQVQRRYFSDSFGDRVPLLQAASLDEVEIEEGFVVANELFDAFPCELFFKGQMAYVGDGCTISFGEAESAIAATAQRYGIVKGEIPLGYQEFASQLARALKRGWFVTFDYGDLEPRNDLSIRIYTRHRVYPLFEEGLDLCALYGKSDITYDVPFAQLIDAFQEAGWEQRVYKSQLAALVDFGITQLLEEIEKRAGFEAYRREVEKVKILLHPSMMGERFKMVEFTRGVPRSGATSTSVATPFGEP